MAANPPYGERLGRRDDAEALTRQLGERLRRASPAGTPPCSPAALTRRGDRRSPLKRETDAVQRPARVHALVLRRDDGRRGKAARPTRAATPARPCARRAAQAAEAAPSTAPSEPAAPTADGADGRPTAPAPQARPGRRCSAGGAEQFANRLHKNLRRLGKQLRRDGITCYRLYDADLPDYNLVVDVYGDWVHVQEYAPPAEIDPAKVDGAGSRTLSP